MVRTSWTSLVCLVHLVCFVHLVSLVSLVYPLSLVQPDKRDKPNQPNKQNKPDRLADFFSVRLEGEVDFDSAVHAILKDLRVLIAALER